MAKRDLVAHEASGAKVSGQQAAAAKQAIEDVEAHAEHLEQLLAALDKQLPELEQELLKAEGQSYVPVLNAAIDEQIAIAARFDVKSAELAAIVAEGNETRAVIQECLLHNCPLPAHLRADFGGKLGNLPVAMPMQGEAAERALWRRHAVREAAE